GFSASYTQTFDQFNTLLQGNKAFKEFITQQEMRPELKQRDFAAYLIMPIQRLPRYELLLQNLLKNIPPAYPDYIQIQQALEKANKHLKDVNQNTPTPSSPKAPKTNPSSSVP